MAFSSLTSDQLKSWAEHVRPSSPSGNETGFTAVDEFLTGSGQTALAQQGQLLEQQVGSVFQFQKRISLKLVCLSGPID